MKTVVFKTKGLGCSSISAMESFLQLGHFLFEISELPHSLASKGYLTVLIGEIALVEYFKPASQKVKKPNEVVVPNSRKRLADVVDLSSSVLAFGVRQKQDAVTLEGPGCDVDDFAVWPLPNGMELCLDVDTGDLPDCPARQLHTTLSSNLLWNNGETFVVWLMQQGLAPNRQGSISGSY